MLVLGAGARDVASERRVASRRALDRPRPQLFNHYADGSGFWDGDQIGLEGATTAEALTRWEAMGTTSMGPSLGPQ